MKFSPLQISNNRFIVIEKNAMRPLKLHIKTSLLASLITVLMFVVALAFVSVKIASLLQEKEKDLARLQASEFAEHIEGLQNSQDTSELKQLADLVDNTQPNLTAVRVWKLQANGDFSELTASDDSSPAREIPNQTQLSLLQKQKTEILFGSAETFKADFRAFAPLLDKQQRIFGAIEIAQTLDSPWTIATGYAQSEASVAFATVILIMMSTYLLFRYLVYRPLKLLLSAMSQAETGNLDVQAPVFVEDELGQVATKFNLMVSSLNEMTKEREKYQEILQDKVDEATGKLKNKNEQLSDANRELWQMSRRLLEIERLAAAGQTAAQFAHEVGTPLNLISGHVQLLRLKTQKDDAERLEIISNQIERIERIVRSTLDRTRISQGEQNLVDVNDVLQRTFDATAPTLDEKKVKLIAKLDADLPNISGDADHLQQVFINLINNALDALPNGGELRVSTNLETRGSNQHTVVIDFTDTGLGMTKSVLQKIFDVLYTTKGKHGTGLGLVVVKQIMQEHHGEIEVESEVGKGTTFRLRFPISEGKVSSSNLGM